MKEKFNSIYPIVNSILIIGTLIFKSIDYILWILVMILNIVTLSISLRDDTKAKAGTKIFVGATIVFTIGCIIYKLYEIS
ncbi:MULTISPECIES: hypothetical protein [Clostridium]|uniref:hypothetical protein n=1 Tax=Clostridium TaxID=1485 RepID=UPI000983BAE1|nr:MULTISPECIES: hypothetical protein [Clostridium]AQR94815.1 hypothetical protein CLSAP_21290 [Clostridium saccharoperbutylacetonicum]NSB30656.1 hypothetical protein [Clostridium saccharoperbutylacetonicum]